jgi:hypothetical protein
MDSSQVALGPTSRIATPRPPPVASLFEFWPGWLFYAPVVVQWIALGLRHGDFSLPTAANPEIDTGGLCGESKGAILDQMTGPARGLVAPYACFDVTGTTPIDDADAAMRRASLAFPLVAKPDIGCNGTGVRLVADRPALIRYLDAFPRGRRAMLQEFVPYENEAGLFYIREPGATAGRITSITFKHPPTVTGDGQRTLRALILDHERFSRIPQLFLSRPAAQLDLVPARGERVQLVFVGNHCKGSVFEDGTDSATPALLAAVERVIAALPDFHFGRIDVRFTTLADLRAGTGLRILEVNGVGAEATHVWDPRTRLLDAWRSELAHFGAAWRIGAANRARGAASSGLRHMFRMWRLQRQVLASYPEHD